MKHKLLLSIFLFTTTFGVFAQSPDSFNYQAVIRDASSNILSNQSVGIQFKLLQGSPVGTSVYTETHATTTDTFGLVALAVGTGSSSDDFSTIDWANGPYFLEISADVNGGTIYSVLGTQQLLSTPYALYAKNSGSAAPSDKITDADNNTKIQVEETGNEDMIRFDVAGLEALVIANNGQVTLNANQNRSLLITSNDANQNGLLLLNTTDNESWQIIQDKGDTGAFRINHQNSLGNYFQPLTFNLTGTGQGQGETFFPQGKVGIGMTTTPGAKLHIAGDIKIVDGTQAAGYVLTSDANGLASWQITAGGGVITDTDNDTKIQVEKNTDEDIIRFDIAGTEYYRMEAGRLQVSNTGGSVSIGEGAGLLDDLSDNRNVAIGYNAGRSITAGRFNVALGNWALLNNETGDNNVAIGNNAGRSTTSGSSNVALGNLALRYNTTGNANVAIGNYALTASTTGGANVAIGSASMRFNETGGSNYAIGNNALFLNVSGNNNVAIGKDAGYNVLGTGGVYIGNNAGKNENGSNRLYIDNSNTSTPLIYGEFDNNLVRIGGKLEVTNKLTIGSNGTPLNSIIKVTIGKNLPNISAGSSYTTTFTVTGASVGGVVSVSPEYELTNGLIISYARVSSSNTIAVKFRNVRNSGIDEGYIYWFISVIN